MKIAAYDAGSGPRIGVVLGDRIVDSGLEGPLAGHLEGWSEVAPRLALQPSAVRRVREEANREFRAAWRAAARAAAYACWRPEAAESVVQAARRLDLSGEAGAEVMAPEASPAPVEPVAPKPAHPARSHSPLAGRVN
ncbi:MAG: hypothetical protein ACKOEY_02200, partial [Phenylobacterium sp.]